MSNPEIRVLLELRTQLGEELDRLRERIEQIEEFIQALDATIGRGSFATADAAIGTTATETVDTSGEPRSILILNKSGDLEMATIEVIDQNLRIVPAEHAVYNITRGAFARFFIQDILGKFQQEDKTRVENGEIEWEDSFDFEVKSEDKILDEVVVKNYGDEARLEEIQRTLRWTLEKIYKAR